MTRKLDPAKLNDAISAYQAGKSVREAAASTGIGASTLNRAIRATGVYENRQRLPVPPGLVADFLAGESVKSLSIRHGIDRNAVTRMLREADIGTRSRSSAMSLRWERSDQETRTAMLNAAHAASKGRTATEAERIAIALAKAGRISSPYEHELGAIVALHGADVSYSVPCGRYNIDIVAGGTVAVEVFGGNWHANGRHAARFGKRSRYILDAAYDLLVIWTGKRTFDPVACTEHVIALTQIPGRDPAAARQYWVIRGDGQVIAKREDDLAEVPLIMPAGGSDGTGT